MADLRAAETLNDARIEALVQSLLAKAVRQASLRDMAYDEVACAFAEAWGRWMMGPFLAEGLAPDNLEAADRAAARLAWAFEARLKDIARGLPPGKDGIGGTRGNA
jgi:hypothetical protein